MLSEQEFVLSQWTCYFRHFDSKLDFLQVNKMIENEAAEKPAKDHLILKTLVKKPIRKLNSQQPENSYSLLQELMVK